MKTLVLIVLFLMAWKGIAMSKEFEPQAQRQTSETPEWLDNWYQEFEEEERQREEELQRRLRQRDVRKDEGRQGLA